MNYFCRKIIFIILFALATDVLSWNAVGHRLIAQIAYDQLTPKAKILFNKYNQALDQVYPPQDFINAAVWLDSIRFQEIHWYDSLHYIDLPFSEDGSEITLPSKQNALTGIDYAYRVLINRHSNFFDKGIALRMILHLVADIHQPLHTVNEFSKNHPHGDLGGNLYKLTPNSVANNLHRYWDRGGGLLLIRGARNPQQIKRKANQIQEKWPCLPEHAEMNTSKWAKESYWVAINEAYHPLKYQSVDKKYKARVKSVSEKRIALAGCRLGFMLNMIAKQGV